MRGFVKLWFLLGLLIFLSGSETQNGNASGRKFYAYEGNYQDQVNDLKKKFKSDYGYELLDLGEAWKPSEIEKLQKAFAQLPDTFHRLPGLNFLYRLDRIHVGPPSLPAEEIPAATLPTFTNLYERHDQTYKVYVEDQELRVEFYNPLFYESTEDFTNIVHHEMAHAFDAAHKFLTFSPEWITLSRFRVIHLPALDARPESNFLYTFLNDSEVDNYAPVSTRNLPTYSRQNIQEDFANSVAAYIHYPYFQSSHPARYGFLKRRVFNGKEYFPAEPETMLFRERIIKEINPALEGKDWEQVKLIAVELSRGYFPKVEEAVVGVIQESLAASPDSVKDLQLGLASCFLHHPMALELRRTLIREKRVSVKMFLENERCFRIARDFFANNLAKRAPFDVLFFREGRREILQFLDPALRVAHARGFHSRYNWRIHPEGEERKILAEGHWFLAQGGNGTVKIDLRRSAGKDFTLPEGRRLILELNVRRSHPKTFKTFHSSMAQIRFVFHSWFNYEGPNPPQVQVVFPVRSSSQAQK